MPVVLLDSGESNDAIVGVAAVMVGLLVLLTLRREHVVVLTGPDLEPVWLSPEIVGTKPGPRAPVHLLEAPVDEVVGEVGRLGKNASMGKVAVDEVRIQLEGGLSSGNCRRIMAILYRAPEEGFGHDVVENRRESSFGHLGRIALLGGACKICACLLVDLVR